MSKKRSRSYISTPKWSFLVCLAIILTSVTPAFGRASSSSAFILGGSLTYGRQDLPAARGNSIISFVGPGAGAEARLIIPSRLSDHFTLEIIGVGSHMLGKNQGENSTVTEIGGGVGFALGPLALALSYASAEAKTRASGFVNSFSFTTLALTPSLRLRLSDRSQSTFLSFGFRFGSSDQVITQGNQTVTMPCNSWSGSIGVNFGLEEFF